MNRSAPDEPRVAELPHDSAMTLALNEYRRFGELLLALHEEDWTTPTECPGWDVRAMASHALAMVEMSASYRENNRQVKAARRRGGDFLDALTAVQVEEHADLAPEVITERYLARSPKAARARRRLPGLIRRRALPVPQVVGGQEERWTVGYLTDVIFTRDPWMHRIDITRATGAELVHTVGHDAAIVADVVLEWADRHGRPYTLHLAGPAGGEWSRGTGGPSIDLDAVAFCRIVSGRGPAEGLLTTQVPF
jgi:uncharacterized protein (TIGR03083 family)